MASDRLRPFGVCRVGCMLGTYALGSSAPPVTCQSAICDIGPARCHHGARMRQHKACFATPRTNRTFRNFVLLAYRDVDLRNAKNLKNSATALQVLDSPTLQPNISTLHWLNRMHGKLHSTLEWLNWDRDKLLRVGLPVQGAIVDFQMRSRVRWRASMRRPFAGQASNLPIITLAAGVQGRSP